MGTEAISAEKPGSNRSPGGNGHPKDYRSPMPAMGVAQLTPAQVSAVATYIWALSQGSGNEQNVH